MRLRLLSILMSLYNVVFSLQLTLQDFCSQIIFFHYRLLLAIFFLKKLILVDRLSILLENRDQVITDRSRFFMACCTNDCPGAAFKELKTSASLFDRDIVLIIF